MQPTLTPVDVIPKAINNLMHALKQNRNTKGMSQIEALMKMDKLFNKLTRATETTTPQSEMQPNLRVTFNKTTKPPIEIPNPMVAMENES
jgi:hypothetical protein